MNKPLHTHQTHLSHPHDTDYTACNPAINTNTKAVDHWDRDLQLLFSATFFHTFNTVLVGGANEPLYEPSKTPFGVNCIYYRSDYFSSALHEIAHWCIAGKERRKQVDYGYWYAPDGRDSQQQKAFEKVECKPQAIEYAFSLAAGSKFRVSIDNLSASDNDSTTIYRQEKAFSEQVKNQLVHYITEGFPHRANLFLQALHKFYHTPDLSMMSIA